ncbi:hypothetical protein BDN71DRAFT_1457943 [Pleurotus eryngii]|uniref:Uncharacterized protein n=1 Tax=Pleurotus eryngii TaxID=5323 RepID=A0A9P5ZGP9_PLEER|nr:hypothetical protein BDN71DRAFT_1457943 [Pleurotus eryngii]
MKPKKLLAGWQHWNNQVWPTLKAGFDEQFEASGLPLGKRASERNAYVIAKFHELPPSEQERQTQEAIALHEAAKQAVADRLDQGITFTPEERQSLLSRAFPFLDPLLSGMSEALGMHVSVFIGGPEPGKGGQLNVISSHHGKNRAALPQTWAYADKVKFKVVTENMLAYLRTCYTTEDCNGAAIPGTFEDDNAGNEDSQSHVSSKRRPHASASSDEDVEEDLPRRKKKKRTNETQDGKKPTPSASSKRRRNTPPVPSSKGPTYENITQRDQANMIELPSGEWVPIVRNKKFTIPASPLSHRKSTVPRSPPSAPYAFGPRGVVRSSRLDTTPTRASPSEKSTPLLTSEEPAEDAAPPLPLVSPLPADTVDPGATSDPMVTELVNVVAEEPTPADPVIPDTIEEPLTSDLIVANYTSDATAEATAEPVIGDTIGESVIAEPVIAESVPVTAKGDNWFAAQHTYYSNLQLGTGWMGLLKAFQRVEAANDYFDPPGRISLATGNRPLEVKWWISRGRKYTVSIERPVDDYAEQWWGWWNGLQPEGRPLSGPEGVQDVPQVADWTALDKPGVNGFLTVVATLAWWGAKLKEEKHATQLERLEDDQLEGQEEDTTEDVERLQSWTNAVIDVTAVMNVMADIKGHE